MVEMGARISLDGVAVHLDCWCICLCYLHFAPEMYLLVLAHPGCPGQSPESHKMVVVLLVVTVRDNQDEADLYQSVSLVCPLQ